MDKETIKTIATIGEEVAEAVIHEVTDTKEETETSVTKATGIIGTVLTVVRCAFKYKKVIAIALSLIGLGGVAGGFTVVADSVCAVSASFCE